MPVDEPPVEAAAFWDAALSHAGHGEARVVRTWRSRRHDNAEIDTGRQRWIGRAPLLDAAAISGVAPAHVAVATEAALLGRLQRGDAELGVLAPALLTHGRIGDRPFVVQQWIDGDDHAVTEDELATVCERLRHYRTTSLPRDYADQWHAGRRPGINLRIATIEEWAAKLGDAVDLTRLLAIVRDPPDSIQTSFSHGSFDASKLRRNAAGLWLLDFEQAAAQRAEFFDPAFTYFTLRMLPRDLSPGSFAVRFRKALPRGERRRFRHAFRWHVAALVIGGYRDHLLGTRRIPRVNLDLLASDVLRSKLAV